MRECSLSLGQEVYVGESSEVDTVQDNTSKKQKKGILMTAGLFLLELMIVLFFSYFKPLKPIKRHKTTGCAPLFIVPYVFTVHHLHPAPNVYDFFDGIWCIHYYREIKNKHKHVDARDRKHNDRTQASPISCPVENQITRER